MRPCNFFQYRVMSIVFVIFDLSKNWILNFYFWSFSVWPIIDYRFIEKNLRSMLLFHNILCVSQFNKKNPISIEWNRFRFVHNIYISFCIYNIIILTSLINAKWKICLAFFSIPSEIFGFSIVKIYLIRFNNITNNYLLS